MAGRGTPTPLHPLLPDRDKPAGGAPAPAPAPPKSRLDRKTPSLPPAAAPPGGSPAWSGERTGSPGETSRSVILHTVIKEDTLEGIALRYGIEVSALRSVNGLWPHESVRSAGRKHLYVPVGLCAHLCGADALDAGGGNLGGAAVVCNRSLASPPAAEPLFRDPQRPYGSVAEAGIALYEELDSRERMAAPPFRRASPRRPGGEGPAFWSPASSAAPSQRSSFDQDNDGGGWTAASGKSSPATLRTPPPASALLAADAAVFVPVQVVPQRQLSYFPGRSAKSQNPPPTTPPPPPAREPQQPLPPQSRRQSPAAVATGQRPAWALLSRVASAVSRRKSEGFAAVSRKKGEGSAAAVQDGTVELQVMSGP